MNKKEIAIVKKSITKLDKHLRKIYTIADKISALGYTLDEQRENMSEEELYSAVGTKLGSEIEELYYVFELLENRLDDFCEVIADGNNLIKLLEENQK